MGVIKWNNADVNVADGTAITAANSGSGRAGDAFNAVATHAAHTYTALGSPQRGMGWFTVSPGAPAYNEWSITNVEFWGSGYWRFYEGAGGGESSFVQALGAADALAARISYDTTSRKIAVSGQSGGTTSTGVHVPPSQWMRVDWHFKMHATTGVAEARIYFDVVGAPYTYETITYSAGDTLGTMAKLRIGVGNTPAGFLWHAYDDIIIDDRNWVDRRPHPVSRMGRALSR